jgi:hypothetical protein
MLVQILDFGLHSRKAPYLCTAEQLSGLGRWQEGGFPKEDQSWQLKLSHRKLLGKSYEAVWRRYVRRCSRQEM